MWGRERPIFTNLPGVYPSFWQHDCRVEAPDTCCCRSWIAILSQSPEKNKWTMFLINNIECNEMILPDALAAAESLPKVVENLPLRCWAHQEPVMNWGKYFLHYIQIFSDIKICKNIRRETLMWYPRWLPILSPPAWGCQLIWCGGPEMMQIFCLGFRQK